MRRTGLSGKTKWKLAFLLVAALASWLYFYAKRNLKPIATTLAESQAKILCMRAINEAVVEALGEMEIDYEGLVTILRDANDEVIAIETDAVEVNRTRAQLTDAVSARLELIGDQIVTVPLGTLFSIDWLSGKGPGVTLKMIPSAYVESSLVNRFDTAGINQTRHQIMVRFDVTMKVILVPYSTSVDVSADVCIAETIIIGNIPQTYAEM